MAVTYHGENKKKIEVMGTVAAKTVDTYFPNNKRTYEDVYPQPLFPSMSKNYIPIKFHDNFSLWLNQTSHEICLE
jgi:hypothetical protein